ncbi:MAG: hypothetical protein ACREIL_09525, partial [Nitrospiraceae bacterium]
MLLSTKSGTISTVAGTGEPAHAGDGGPAVSAALNEPRNIALDRAGHLYIADSENHVIRRVDLKTGIVVTVAGCPGAASSGQEIGGLRGTSAAEEAEEDLLGGPQPGTPQQFAHLADLIGTVRFVVGAAAGRFHGDGGPASQATLNVPSAVVADEAGNLYIADTMNHRIRRVEAATATMMTIAGTGQRRFSGDGGPAVSAALNEPTALAVDRKGHLYIADQSNNRVRRVELATGIITTVAGSGEAGYTGDGILASETGLAGPSGLALGPDGALYIADTFNGRIRRVDAETGLISTVAGDGGEYRYQGRANEFSTSLSRPYGIALDREGHILI